MEKVISNDIMIVLFVLICCLSILLTMVEGSPVETRSNPGSIIDPHQSAQNPNTGNEPNITGGATTTVQPVKPQVPEKILDKHNQSSSCLNGTDDENCKRPLGQVLTDMIQENKGMLTRTLWVLMGVTVIVVAYFVMRGIRTRKRSKSKKYGVISSQESELEMRPLDDDDDEEDMTVFEVNGLDFRSTERMLPNNT